MKGSMDQQYHFATACLVLLLSASASFSASAFSSSSRRMRRMPMRVNIRQATKTQEEVADFNETSPTLEGIDEGSIMTDEEMVDNLSNQMNDFITTIHKEIEDLPSLDMDQDLDLERVEDGLDYASLEFLDEEEDPVLKRLEENLLATIELLEDTLQETQIMNELETMELKDQNDLLQKDLEEQKIISSQAIAQLQVERIILEKQTSSAQSETANTGKGTAIPSESRLPDYHYQSWSPAMVSMFLQAQQEQHDKKLKDLKLELEQEQENRKLAESKAGEQVKAVAVEAANNVEPSESGKILQATIQKQQELLNIANQKITKLGQDISASKTEFDIQRGQAKEKELAAAKREEELLGNLFKVERDNRKMKDADTKNKSSLAQLRFSQGRLEAAVEKAQGERQEAKQRMAATKEELVKAKRSVAASMAQVSRLDTKLAKFQKQQQLKIDWDNQQKMKEKEKQLLEKKRRQEKIDERRRQKEKEKRDAANSAAASARKSSYQSGRSGKKATTAQNQSTMIPRLENWELTLVGEIQGAVFNHPSLPNGEPVRTSILVNPRIAKDGVMIKTRSGSMYKLGRAKASATEETEPKAVKPKTMINLFGGLSTPVPSPSSSSYKQKEKELLPQNDKQAEAVPTEKSTAPTLANIFNQPKRKEKSQGQNAEEGENKITLSKQRPIPSINLFGASKDSKKEEVTKEEGNDDVPPTPKIQALSLNFFGKSKNTVKDTNAEDESGEEPTASVSPFGKYAKATSQKQKLSAKSTATVPSTSTFGKYTKATPQRQAVSTRPAVLDLTGTSIMNGKYLLAGKAKRSVTGRCLITGAYRSDANNNPTGKPLIIKISENGKAMQKEHSIYKKVISGVNRGVIVKCFEYVPAVEDRPGKSALVLERGVRDLKEHRKWHSFTGEELKQALFSISQCMECMHNARMVWTDLKTENFVVVEDEKGEHRVKAIDLESAMIVKDHPIDYTPEATPPEFAKDFLSGDPRSFVLDFSFDVWSFGMLAYELTTGVGYFDGNSADAIMQKLSQNNAPNTSIGIGNDDLADLIAQCLSLDPQQRPSAQKIARHPYFSSMAKPGIFSLW